MMAHRLRGGPKHRFVLFWDGYKPLNIYIYILEMEPTVRLAEVSRPHEHELADGEDILYIIYIGDGTNCALGRGLAIS